jgi:hypothetical protein
MLLLNFVTVVVANSGCSRLLDVRLSDPAVSIGVVVLMLLDDEAKER